MATLIQQESSAAWNGTTLSNLNERTSALLKEIGQVIGAQNAFVCDRHGTTLGALVIGKFDRDTFNRVGTCLAESFAALDATKFREIELRFANRILYARNLGNAFIAVVGALEMNLALLRMTLNVAAVPFESDTKLQSNLQTATPPGGKPV